MTRRAATAVLPGVLALLLVSAGPALAKDKPDQGAAKGPGAGAGKHSVPDPGASAPSAGGSGTGDGATAPSEAPHPTTKSGSSKSRTGPVAPTEPAQASPRAAAPQVAATPASDGPTVGSGSGTGSGAARTSTTSALVRAAAAPVAAGSDDTVMPAPDPLLLPESAAAANGTNAAPVAAEHSSLPADVPVLLIGAGILSAAAGSTVLARRRHGRVRTADTPA